MTDLLRAEHVGLDSGARAAVLQARADLLLSLSRAFLPPPPGWTICDWSQPLADDLDELSALLPVNTIGLQQALTRECARWAAAARNAAGSADSWLVEYTRLFLVPPLRVPLNTGLYLEGSLAGSAAQMMRACYEVAGLLAEAHFHDLPDHVAIQLEFLGRLYERAAVGDGDGEAMAQEFTREFVAGWSPSLEQACSQAAAECPAAAVYRELAGLVRQCASSAGREMQ